MREIEVKLKVESLEDIAKKLEEMGCKISHPIHQTDINFVHKEDRTWFESNLNSNYCYPRIRIQEGKPLRLTNKKPVTGEMDCLEHEVEVNSVDEARGLISLFGYIEGVTVSKTRRTTTYKNYKITLDEVLELGSYIEIEVVVEDETDPISIQNEMFDFAKENFGLIKDEEVMKGYDIMMYYKKNSR